MPETRLRGYLDAASSEPLHPAARETLLAALERGYADPRRLHGPGRDARLLLDNAREVVAECLGVRPDEVTFTSSGTDAVHRGLLGLRRTGPGVASRPSSTPRSTTPPRWSGPEPGRGPGRPPGPRRDGRVVPARAWPRCSRPTTRSGPSSPLAELDLDVPLFVDACASMGRLPLPERWDVVAGSAHKWGGPAGVGVLVVRKGTLWVNPFPGDDRIDERTVGFENVPAALAAAAALQAVVAERAEVNARQFALVDRIRPPSPRSPTSRWSATRSTGSPTWSPSPASTSTARRS